MWKIISIALLLICAKTFGVPARQTPTPQEQLDRSLKAVEEFKELTVEKLTPEQLQLLRITAQELDVTLDDILLFVRLGAQKTKEFFVSADIGSIISQTRSLQAAFEKLTNEIAELKDPKEITVEKLSRDHPVLWNQLTKELNASTDDILVFAKFTTIIRPYGITTLAELSTRNDEVVANVISKIQQETAICPVPPVESSEKPTSDELQKYIRQYHSRDSNSTSGRSLTSELIISVKKLCYIPFPVMKKLPGMDQIFRQLLSLSLIKNLNRNYI